ncbi:hypothetical protein KIW84_042114 [Lathyrus oleraceus]|uniref:Glycine-rich protein n=2 Tax=Pisum sativum TaxID=3888 RepID=A0A9D4XEH6_PEA|nr:hypothetical protein KIW84_042114 [Pisum sativum]
MIFHHGGNFIHEKHTFYRGGSEAIVEGKDPDKWIKEIANYYLENNVDGQIWVEHGIEDMLRRVLRPNVDKSIEGSDDVNNGDDVRGIQFDDSEEEITCERDEEFVKVIVERPTHGNKVEFNGESLRFKAHLVISKYIYKAHQISYIIHDPRKFYTYRKNCRIVKRNYLITTPRLRFVLFHCFWMQGRGGPGGRDHLAEFGSFGGFGPSRSLMSSMFGGRDPFDDPFFTSPFGGMFQSSIMSGPSGFPSFPEMQRPGFPFPPEIQGPDFPFAQNMQMPGFPFAQNMLPSGFPFGPDMNPSVFHEHQARAPEPSSRRGPIIQQLDSDDENEDETEEKKENPKKHRRSTSTEPTVEHPDDELEGKKIRHLQGRNEFNSFNATELQPQTHSFSFQSSTVSYGGPNGTYYTSSKTRRTGSDGVTLEESKEADSSTRQASHRLSRGLHDKGHTLSRKLNPDGKVDTMQTLHNIDEDELAGFEEEWKGKGQKYLPGWSGSIGAGHSRQAGRAGQGGLLLPSSENGQRGLLLPSSENSHPLGSSQVRGNAGSSRARERVRTDSNSRDAYHPGRQGQN